MPTSIALALGGAVLGFVSEKRKTKRATRALIFGALGLVAAGMAPKVGIGLPARIG